MSSGHGWIEATDGDVKKMVIKIAKKGFFIFEISSPMRKSPRLILIATTGATISFASTLDYFTHYQTSAKV
jgi:hypothetical protein